jgi:hypothetical protein
MRLTAFTLIVISNQHFSCPYILGIESGKRRTPELTRRPTIATTRIEPANEHERQAEGGRVQ